jgi:MFS family permease
MTPTEDQGIPRRSSKLILLSVCIGQIIVGLDQRAITVALPTLATTFHAAFTTIQWTILVYDLVLIGLIITMGRLGDLFGRRRFYSLGFVDQTLHESLGGFALLDRTGAASLLSAPVVSRLVNHALVSPYRHGCVLRVRGAGAGS